MEANDVHRQWQSNLFKKKASTATIFQGTIQKSPSASIARTDEYRGGKRAKVS